MRQSHFKYKSLQTKLSNNNDSVPHFNQTSFPNISRVCGIVRFIWTNPLGFHEMMDSPGGDEQDDVDKDYI